jgi:hypothetical protein
MKKRGITFDHAWRVSIERVKWPHDKQSRHEWKAAMDETRSVWEDCYLDRGTPIDVERLIEHLARPR